MRSLAIATMLIPLAIVRRADVPDSRYVELGSRFPAVIALGRAGDATLISDRWLITAAHVARSGAQAGSKMRIGSRAYMIDEVILHPRWRELGPHDVALIRVANPVTGIKPIGIYRAATEKGQIATIVGHGMTGTGTSRKRVDDGRRRGATSRVDSVNASWMYFSFDQRGTAVEGAPGAGDSGGPAILTVNGEPKVAGISSAGFDGRFGPGTYGAVDAFTRVSSHLGWIDSVMSAPRSQTVQPQTKSAELPTTPIGSRYRAFLDAVKLNTEAALTAFVKENFLESEVTSRPALIPNLRRLSGLLQGAAIEQVVSSSESALAVRFRTSTGLLTLELVCYYQDHCKLTDWRRMD